MSQVSFPVFRIPNDYKLLYEGTVVYTYQEFMDEDNNIIPQIRILDDISIDKPSLGLRRLELMVNKVPLIKLSKAIFFIGDIIKQSAKRFIDSSGKIFVYVKTKTVPLVFKRITKKWRNPNGVGSIFEVDGVPSRFKTIYSLQPEDVVAGLLKIGSGYVLYGIYTEMYDNTRRKV